MVIIYGYSGCEHLTIFYYTERRDGLTNSWSLLENYGELGTLQTNKSIARKTWLTIHYDHLTVNISTTNCIYGGQYVKKKYSHLPLGYVGGLIIPISLVLGLKQYGR